MHRLLVALAALGLVSAAFACGGGGHKADTKTYAPTVVSIKRASFKGVELSVDDLVQPSFADQYPAVVATVNDQQVSGHDLAAREVELEMGRHQWENTTPEDFAPGYVQSQIDNAESADPLELEIDDALERSAANRLGLMPSNQEAEDAAKKYDQYLQTLLDDSAVTAEDRAQWIRSLTVQGQLEAGWWSQPKWVKQFRENMGVKALRDRYCQAKPTPTIKGFLNLFTSGRNCDDFLAKERKNAKIVYYVRWAD